MIPLAPLGVDAILGGAFTTMGRYAKPLFGVAALVHLALGVLAAGAATLAYGMVSDHVHRLVDGDGPARWADLRPPLLAFGVVWALALVALQLATAVVQAACAVTLQEAVLGRPARFADVLRGTRGRTPSVLGVSVLSGLAVLVPTVLALAAFAATIAALASGAPAAAGLLFLLTLLLVPSAVWVYTLFVFAPSAAVLETASPVTAMRRSVRLVRGAWWRTFGVTVLAGAITATAASVLRMPLMFTMPVFSSYDPAAPPADPSEVLGTMLPALGPYLALTVAATFLTQLVSSVFLPLVTTLLYVDRRIRREGLADALARAAAGPAASTAPPGAAPGHP
ncbi:hypothetical protein ACGFS9_23855 [Streptomyces sp. NPDC048566]|uniref:DUF7847 domain-containing protein n=1 Tax=Streptomyces sp. NPDC048566 TaxID=3365569 RepID=UPI00371FEFD0